LTLNATAAAGPGAIITFNYQLTITERRQPPALSIGTVTVSPFFIANDDSARTRKGTLVNIAVLNNEKDIKGGAVSFVNDGSVITIEA
jgi:hypothetical protein